MASRFFSVILLGMFERRRSAKGHVRPAQKLLLSASEVITECQKNWFGKFFKIFFLKYPKVKLVRRRLKVKKWIFFIFCIFLDFFKKNSHFS